jgi:SAM-dependent methyltransferase
VSEGRDWATVFNQTFARDASAVEERIWHEVMGEEYPAGLDTFSWLSRTELDRITTEVRIQPDDTLADLGCGRGGPGLWVAAQSGARLVGVDISSAALDAARERARALGLEGRCEWRVGSFEKTTLDDSSLDAAMSVDALLFTPDKAMATKEFARILRPGGRLVMTTWDYHSQPVGRPPQVPDHRPLLEDWGFDVLAYEETEDWKRRQDLAIEGLLAALDELAAESGEDRAEIEADILEMRATGEHMTRRVLMVAQLS